MTSSQQVVVSKMPDATNTAKNRREIAESEDIYFGGGESQQDPYYEGLLGQALQGPSYQNMNGHTNMNGYHHPHHPSHNLEEEASPLFFQLSDSESHQSFTTNSTADRPAPTMNARKAYTTNENSYSGQSGTYNHFYDAQQQHQPHDDIQYNRLNSSSTAATRLHDNRQARDSYSSYQNYHTHISHNPAKFPHKQDPLCLSGRSLQSDDTGMASAASAAALIPQSVDTVPTSNVATLQHYQRQYQQQQQQHQHWNKNFANENGNGNHYQNQQSNSKQLHNSPEKDARLCVSPPSQLRMFHPPNHHHAMQNSNANARAGNRRTVFGSRVQQRYPAYANPMIATATNTANNSNRQHVYSREQLPADPAPFYNIIDTGEQITFQQAQQQPWEMLLPSSDGITKSNSLLQPPPSSSSQQQQKLRNPSALSTTAATMTQELDDDVPLPVVVTATTTNSTTPTTDSSTSSNNNNIEIGNPFQTPHSSLDADAFAAAADMVSPLQSPQPVTVSMQTPPRNLQEYHDKHGSLTASANSTLSKRRNRKHHSRSSTRGIHHRRKQRIHETVHAQSLLLGLCFMAIWSPNNIMAPNLTQIATYFDMTENERDLYLGSFLALATGVLSFPISALIGIFTDLYSRKHLFVLTAMGGAMASAATGLSPTYPCLLLARFFSGGFMSASVSVAFSLMGDLFATEERNAASSGLTAMMGLGIILGQVYAGVVGNSKGWQHAFWVSSCATVFLGICVAIWVQEPVRGGKEKVLQDMLKQGKRYDRKLTWDSFWHAMTNNRSNAILMAQGFFSSLPWGIIFVFLNDYLSQERGFSVPDATFIVLVFGMGCAAGGILGGYMGTKIQAFRRSFLPLFMAVTTFLGYLPFYGLLNGHTTNAHGRWAIMYSLLGGCISSMPAVNVRPCLINVNPPETRGASLTAANLIINVARGVGPSCITLLGSSFDLTRQLSFNITLLFFWTVSAIQLCLLARSLPQDQDKMEAELAQYAASALALTTPDRGGGGSVVQSPVTEFETERPESLKSLQDDISLVSIEDRITAFDQTAARESISFIKKGVKELEFNFPGTDFCAVHHPGGRFGVLGIYEEEDSSVYDDAEEGSFSSECDSDDDDEEQQSLQDFLGDRDEGDDNLSPTALLRRRDLWKQQQQKLYGSTTGTGGRSESKTDSADHPTEGTPLI